ncbi:sensor histidine kinase [Ancylomarina sp. 16SWW S1-10-2]|uniref:sensor histidine kinase n=1 Tax=Ancylomarina sp. 16SWW S1-10-2 TaxID=2499681 RepID=UPI00189E09FE|nr:sensor histidine kinase [Ancylomarina sp. 16SWW S1-10-2]
MKKNNMIRNIINQSNKGTKSPFRRILSRTLLVFLPIFILMFIGSLSILLVQERMELRVLLSAKESQVNNKLDNIETEIDHVIDNLLILSLNKGVVKVLEDGDSSLAVKLLADDFKNLSAYYKFYDQIRLINENGDELIRINFINGQSSAVPESELQNKKDRYYFKDAFKLDKNDVFVSPIDLNIEEGKIEAPLKPVIRFATPVFDSKGVKRGVILFNYLGQTILDQVDKTMMLLNSDGYWLKGSSPEDEWGFMYENKKELTFQNRYPAEWLKIQNEDASQFINEKGLFTFKTIYPLKGVQIKQKKHSSSLVSSDKKLVSSHYNWKIVSYTPLDELYLKRDRTRKYFGLLMTFLFVSLLAVSYRLAKAQHYRREALKSLKISNDTKDKFFSIISHDLRSPFNSLLGFTDMLIKNYDTFSDEERMSIIETLNASSKTTYLLLENLLSWSSSQTGSIKFAPQKIEIKDLVQEIILLSKSTADKKHIDLVDNTEDNQFVYADKNMLSTVLRNLITNAMKFTESNGKVIISSERSTKKGFVKISVMDTGIGIPANIIDNLFLLDKNISTLGTDAEKGSGLGLILCKEFIEKQGGEIYVESEVGKGSQFKLILPE